MFLNCHSYFSLQYGTLKVEQLLEAAGEMGINRFALTDINNTSAHVTLMREAPRYGIDPVPGIDFRNGIQPMYIGLPLNQDGYEELNRHLSQYLEYEKPFPEKAPEFNHVLVIYPFSAHKVFALRDNEYIGVRQHELNRLLFSPWASQRDKLVALHPVTFLKPKDFNAHRLLRAVHHNTLLSKLPVSEQALKQETLVTEEALLAEFEGWPHLVHNARRLLDQCKVDLSLGISKNRRLFGNNEAEDMALLRSLSEEGARKRYGDITPQIAARIENELDIIGKKNFISYFLINWDMVKFAQHRNFFYVGRGSGANSVLAYCLEITDVDPVELDLYFERFINLHRQNPPDFDIDFSWKDRDEIISYLFNKYGKEHTALVGSYNTFQTHSMMRQLGKVFGMPKAEIEELLSLYDKKDKERQAPTDLGQLVWNYGDYLRDMPSHLSIHASGLLISDAPLYRHTATFSPPKGFPVSQFSMIEAEDIGLYKFDILSQRGLGHIRDTIGIVRENRGHDINIRNIPAFKHDEAIRNLLSVGHTMGCFYVESPGMRMLLRKLETKTYLELVAASSIIRPGVANSGMMRAYILRHRKPELREKVNKELLELMPETYGVMVYQEDVIKVAHFFAKLTLAEADILRRSMSGKYKTRAEFVQVKEKFFRNCHEIGHDEQLAAEVWMQIESFAAFSFAKGHSASFAVESYQSLYLKAHYPLEFMVGVINNFGGFYQTEFYVHEARKSGAVIEGPDINQSNYLTRIEDHTIYLGLVHLSNLEKKMADIILDERQHNGRYQSLDDIITRTGISLEQLIIIIRIGALRFTGKSKQQLLWEAHFMLGKGRRSNTGNTLFRTEPRRSFDLPPLLSDYRDDMLDELELLGFTLTPPFALLADPSIEGIAARDIPAAKGKQVQVLGHLVITKHAYTAGGESMYFGTFLDKEGQWIDTVHFPPVARRYPFKGNGIYLLNGKVTEEFGFYTVEVERMQRLDYWNRGTD